jgi:hypothetical protein
MILRADFIDKRLNKADQPTLCGPAGAGSKMMTSGRQGQEKHRHVTALGRLANVGKAGARIVRDRQFPDRLA